MLLLLSYISRFCFLQKIWRFVGRWPHYELGYVCLVCSATLVPYLWVFPGHCPRTSQKNLLLSLEYWLRKDSLPSFKSLDASLVSTPLIHTPFGWCRWPWLRLHHSAEHYCCPRPLCPPYHGPESGLEATSSNTWPEALPASPPWPLDTSVQDTDVEHPKSGSLNFT